PDLRTLVRANGRLEPQRAARIVAQLAGALDAAHARGIVHRDVKPENVLVGPGEHVYLTDFGLTKRLDSSAAPTRAGGWVGTLGYVAPEQIRGERPDAPRATTRARRARFGLRRPGAPPLAPDRGAGRGRDPDRRRRGRRRAPLRRRQGAEGPERHDRRQPARDDGQGRRAPERRRAG